MTASEPLLFSRESVASPVASLVLRPYRLAYETPFRTARGIFTHREGTHIVAKLVDGTWGIGDAASWPGFGGGPQATSDALEALLSAPVFPIWPHALDEHVTSLGRVSQEAGAGVETACLDAWARAKQVTLAGLVSSDVATHVGVHARADNAFEAQRAVSDGAQAIKVKVGLMGLADEVTRIGAIRAAVGDAIKLRLDANGAWPMEVAMRAVRLFSAFAIDWLEEPIAPGDWRGLAALRQLGGVPLAADESLASEAAFESMLTSGGVDVAVIKPMYLGGPRRALSAIARAQQQGLRVCVTHAMESGVGQAMALQVALAARIKSPCGLSPTRLRHDTCGYVVRGHKIRAPEGPGLNLWPLGLA